MHEQIIQVSDLCNALVKLELMKATIVAIPEDKMCACYKKIYENYLSFLQLCLLKKSANEKCSFKFDNTLFVLLPECDERAIILAYIIIKPIIKQIVKSSYYELLNKVIEYANVVKLMLGGIHIDCKNIECCFVCDNTKSCKQIDKCSCAVFEGKPEYLRFYVNKYVIHNKPYLLRYLLKLLSKLHTNFESCYCIIDYKNMKNYTWTEESYKRWKLIKRYFKDRIFIINYQDVSFGQYFDEIKPYLRKEAEIEFFVNGKLNSYKCENCVEVKNGNEVHTW